MVSARGLSALIADAGEAITMGGAPAVIDACV